MSNIPISNLPLLEDIIDTDSLVLIKDNIAYTIPFSKFKLSAENFFTAPDIIKKSQNNIDLLKKFSVRTASSVESLSGGDLPQVNTNMYFITDPTVGFDDTRYFMFSSVSRCFIPIDINEGINATWFNVIPGTSNLTTNLQNLINLVSSISECNNSVTLLSSPAEVEITKTILLDTQPHVFDNTLLVPSNIYLKGNNTIFKFNNVTTSVAVTGDNVTLDNIQFLTTQSHLYACNCVGLDIKNCKFKGGRTGMYLTGVSSSKVHMNTFEGNQGVGLRFDKTYDTIIEHNIFKNSTLVEGTWNDRNTHFTNNVDIPGNYITNIEFTNSSTKLIYANTTIRDSNYTDYYFVIQGYGNFDKTLSELLPGETFPDIETTPFHVYTEILNFAPRAVPDLANLHNTMPHWYGQATKAPRIDNVRPTGISIDGSGKYIGNRLHYMNRGCAGVHGASFFERDDNRGWDFGTLDIRYDVTSLFWDSDEIYPYGRSPLDTPKYLILPGWDFNREHVTTGATSFGRVSKIEIDTSVIYKNYNRLYTPKWQEARDDQRKRWGKTLALNQYSEPPSRGVGGTLKSYNDLGSHGSNYVREYNTLIWGGDTLFNGYGRHHAPNYVTPTWTATQTPAPPPEDYWWPHKNIWCEEYMYKKLRHINDGCDGFEFKPKMLSWNGTGDQPNNYIGVNSSILDSVFRISPVRLIDTQAYRDRKNDSKIFLTSNILEASDDGTGVLDGINPETTYNHIYGMGLETNENIIQLPYQDISSIFSETLDRGGLGGLYSDSYTLSPMDTVNSYGELLSYNAYHYIVYNGYTPYSPLTNSIQARLAWTEPQLGKQPYAKHGKSLDTMPSVYDMYYFNGNYIYYDTAAKDLVFSVYSHQRHDPSLSPGDDNYGKPPLCLHDKRKDENAPGGEIEFRANDNKKATLYRLREDDKKPYDSQLTIMFVGLRFYKTANSNASVKRASGWLGHRRGISGQSLDLNKLNTGVEFPWLYKEHIDFPEHSDFIDNLNKETTANFSLSSINTIINDLDLYNGDKDTFVYATPQPTANINV